MSDKFTKIIAVFAILFICGILISVLVPDAEEQTADYSSTGRVAVSNETESEQAVPASEETAQNSLYYYNALDASERTIYEQMYNALIENRETELDAQDTDVVKKIFECVTNDHPEIFYCSAYKIESAELYGKVMQMKFQPTYHMTEETIEECQQSIDRYVAGCIANIPSGADEYTKIKYVYEYIIDKTDYVPNAQNNQNICSVFLGGESVCMGYAKATQYILMQLGIEATLVFGDVQGESHSWNLVRVDGEYYYLDTTWGDAGYVRPNAAMNATVGHGINYEYFLITTQQLMKSHNINNVVPLPACVATRNNYYIREGLYLRAYEEATLATIFDRLQLSSDKSVAFQCADAETYAEVVDRLIVGQEVFQYIENAGSVSYSYNDDLYTLIFWIE